MAPDFSRYVRRTTFALLVLASAATEIAAVEDRPLLSSLAVAAAWVGLAALLGLFARPRDDQRHVPPRYVLVLLLLLGAAPFLIDSLRRRWVGDGFPLELQMVFALRNLGLGLAAFAVWPLCLRLACVVSLFLILFAVSLTSHPAVLWLLGFYSAAGSVWLMLVYWSRLRRSAAVSEVAILEMRSSPGGVKERGVFWLAALLVLGIVGSVGAVVVLGPQQTARVLMELLPTSGGTGSYDPFARGGVNDGDDEVRGDNANSTGMVETDSFLDSPLPSLYDVFNDMYGEPFQPRERERAIALDAQTKTKESKKTPADNLRPSREFPTARKGPRQPREASERTARALFEVVGRTPLHVRVTAFDSFDGVSWQEIPINLTTCMLDKERGSCWMKVREGRLAPFFAENERHQFKIAASLGSLVPTPPHLHRFRVGRVNEEGFFAWGPDRILRMSQRKIPSGVVVETECRTVDPRKLSDVAFPQSRLSGLADAADLHRNIHADVSALAQQWTQEHSRGWPQIAAVVGHLRGEYVHDHAAHSPEGCRDPLGHFLLHAHRGPDYQFASAAALLLRVLGYRTRLVSGFYVSPEHYDPVTRHTPVVHEDLHFWAEVMLPSGDWLTLEPTPGYELLGPNLPWSERALAALLAVACRLWEHVYAVGLCLAGLVCVWWKRRELLDTLAVALFRLFPDRSWRRCVRRVLWLLERRGRWTGRPRPISQTPSAWLRMVLLPHKGGRRLTSLSPLVGEGWGEGQCEIDQLMRIAEWCVYAPELTPPWHEAEVRNICRRVIDVWTLPRWRTIGSASDGQGGCS
ncbi:MAG TPA: transglutaminase-like domain-containing protein [Gemmataceae bacterium]|nr:transglutaminase-like domain-containing protein [Gemmataceae bacterium]